MKTFGIVCLAATAALVLGKLAGFLNLSWILVASPVAVFAAMFLVFGTLFFVLGIEQHGRARSG